MMGNGGDPPVPPRPPIKNTGINRNKKNRGRHSSANNPAPNSIFAVPPSLPVLASDPLPVFGIIPLAPPIGSNPLQAAPGTPLFAIPFVLDPDEVKEEEPREGMMEVDDDGPPNDPNPPDPDPDGNPFPIGDSALLQA